MLHLSTFCFLFYPLVWLCNFCSFDGRQMWSRKKPLLLTQDWLCYCLFLVSFWHSWLGTTSFTTTLRRPFPQRRRSLSPRRRWRRRDWSKEYLHQESRESGCNFCLSFSLPNLHSSECPDWWYEGIFSVEAIYVVYFFWILIEVISGSLKLSSLDG